MKSLGLHSLNLSQKLKKIALTIELLKAKSSTTIVLSLAYHLRHTPAVKMVEEEQAGICCYANSASGFRGILKHRYSDFIVNEVDCNGRVVHLTCLEAPEEVLDVPNNCGIADGLGEAREGQGLDCLDVEKHFEAFKTIAGDSDAELLKGLLVKINKGEKDQCAPIVLTANSDKLHRTAIHNFFKGRLPFLVTDTIDGNDSKSKCVRVRVLTDDSSGRGSTLKRTRDSRGKWEKHKRQKHNGQEFDTRGAESWPTARGKYLQFHLYKENKDTQDALMVLAKMIGVQPKSFGIAGTKDKRAITTQRATIFKQAASKLASLNKRLYGIKVGDFCYVDKGLVLGQLAGNRFTITLRGVVGESEEAIKEAADSFGRSGFINYFGLQRFGTSSVPTFTVGAALLRGEWETALNLILQPRDGERQDIVEAREYFLKTRDADGALLRMPRQLVAERAVLTGLRKDRDNILQAINNIPRTMRMMYVHSYQSYLWNHAASKRIQLFGVDKVVEGDLVFCKETETPMLESGNDVLLEDNNEMNEAPDGENVVDDIVDQVDFHPHVKHVTAEDIACGNFSINDVVLPLPGFKTSLPENDVALVYEDLAEKDGLNLKNSSHNVKEFSFLHLSGGYRRLIQVASDFNWTILKYEDATKPLAMTDWERITKCEKKKEVVSSEEVEHINTCTETAVTDMASNLKEESNVSQDTVCQTAVQLTFTLPSSCYATMAIRELLKISSSVAFHKSLNEEMS